MGDALRARYYRRSQALPLQDITIVFARIGKEERKALTLQRIIQAQCRSIHTRCLRIPHPSTTSPKEQSLDRPSHPALNALRDKATKQQDNLGLVRTTGTKCHESQTGSGADQLPPAQQVGQLIYETLILWHSRSFGREEVVGYVDVVSFFSILQVG
jgi:hypothetical protein